MDEIQEMQGFFLEEALELFEQSRNILLEAEKDENFSSEDVDALFRDIHTLKGRSGSVELHLFAGYVHYLEDFLDMLTKNLLAPTIEMVDFFLEELDLMQDMLEQECSATLDKDIVAQNQEKLLQRIALFKSSSSDISEMQISLEKYSGEFMDMYDSVVDTLNSVKSEENFTIEFVNSLFRSMHTLKGSSSFMGLKAFPQYLHGAEDLLDRARNGKIIYTDALNEALLKIMSDAQTIADNEFNNDLDEELFKKKLQETENILDDICATKDESSTEDIGFVLFDEEDSSEAQDVGFVLFDEEEDDAKEEEVGFVLFDTAENSNTEDSKKIKSTPNIKPAKVVTKEENKTSLPQKKVTQPKKKEKSIKKSAASNSIRVGLEKIDFLMNRVGDLVITKSMLYQFLQDLSQKIDDPSIVDQLDRLDREIRELQEAVMSVRMIPMESVYAKLPKTIRDLAKKLNKKVNFIHQGDSVEIDKMIVEGLTDPLVHIIRNSLDHGIENPETRIEKGKISEGTLTISASQESGHILISIKDDGAGINLEKVTQKAIENNIITSKDAEIMSDEDKSMLIFSAGLSTASEVSDVSGRGVGMDVVLNNINSLGGKISIKTQKDKGSEFIIILPLTLAILDGLNVVIGKEHLIMPLNMIVESIQPTADMIKKVESDPKKMVMLRNEFIPIIRLHNFFGIQSNIVDITKGMLIVTRVASNKVALFVDNFLNQEQIVVKSLEKNFKKIKGVGAATIRGDGSIGLILDVMNIIEERGI